MAKNKKPKKKYRPKRNLLDPVGYLLEGMVTIRSKFTYVNQVQSSNMAAINALKQGTATRKDIGTLVATSNTVLALQQMDIGADCDEIYDLGRLAIINITDRAMHVDKFGSSGADIIALTDLIDLYDAQLDVVNVDEMHRANLQVAAKLAKGEATRLNFAPAAQGGELATNLA